MNDDSVTIFVVDDDAAVRESLGLLLERKGIAVETFASAEAFLDSCPHDARGCAISELRLPGMDGMRLQQAMAERGLRLPLVFLTGHGDIRASVQAIKAGAVDFLTKPATDAVLLETVRAALAEGEKLQCRLERNHCAASRLAGLTQREQDVMRLAIEGLPNKEIARRLDISHRTVEIHKARLMRKTGAASVIDLARLAQAGQGADECLHGKEAEDFGFGIDPDAAEPLPLAGGSRSGPEWREPG